MIVPFCKSLPTSGHTRCLSSKRVRHSNRSSRIPRPIKQRSEIVQPGLQNRAAIWSTFVRIKSKIIQEDS